jgi:spermidine synthase
MTKEIQRPQYIRDGVPDGWVPAKGLPEVLEFKEGLKGIEIGSCHGATTHYLLEMLPNSHITAIDPYEEYDQMTSRDRAHESFQQLMKEYSDRISLIRLRSDDAVDQIENESVDFIFVDGYHSNEQVEKDIRNYYPKLKSGGIMSGHDYNGWSLQTGVNEMATKYNKEVSFCEQDVWYWRKD